mgnify:CR=1 FL=1
MLQLMMLEEVEVEQEALQEQVGLVLALRLLLAGVEGEVMLVEQEDNRLLVLLVLTLELVELAEM